MSVDEKAVKKTPKKKSRPRPSQAVAITVWPANGGPLPESAIGRIEAAVERVTFELFNEGVRVLTQTTKA